MIPSIKIAINELEAKRIAHSYVKPCGCMVEMLSPFFYDKNYTKASRFLGKRVLCPACLRKALQGIFE